MSIVNTPSAEAVVISIPDTGTAMITETAAPIVNSVNMKIKGSIIIRRMTFFFNFRPPASGTTFPANLCINMRTTVPQR